VISAAEGLRDAEQARAEANKRLHDAVKDQKKAAEQGSTAWKKYKDGLKDLNPTQQKLLPRSSPSRASWGSLKGPVNTVVGAISDALLGLLPVFTKVGSGYQDLADIFASKIKQFSGLFTGFKGVGNLIKIKRIFEGTKSVIDNLGTAFTNTFQGLINVAAAAMPYLEDLVKDFAAWTGSLADASGDTKGLRKTLGPMVKAFRGMVSIVKELGGVIINTFNGGSGPINKFIDWIKEWPQGIQQVPEVHEGQERGQAVLRGHAAVREVLHRLHHPHRQGVDHRASDPVADLQAGPG
jgi:hypothetical protein